MDGAHRFGAGERKAPWSTLKLGRFSVNCSRPCQKGAWIESGRFLEDLQVFRGLMGLGCNPVARDEPAILICLTY